MKKHYFLGLAAGRRGACKQMFTHGTKKDLAALETYLCEKYDGEQAMLCKNGRSALALALKAYFKKGDKVIVNGFTCYAVYEAIMAAGLVPVWADISKGTLNYDAETIEDILRTGPAVAASPTSSKDSAGVPPATSPVREKSSGIMVQNALRNPVDTSLVRGRSFGIIIQNTLGNPVDMGAIEKLAEKYNLTIIEDLAHSAGVKYADGREAGTVGAATVLSFGKDKSIDTISGGAVVFRKPMGREVVAPARAPRLADYLRSRWYPAFGAMCRGLSYVHLGGVAMRGLVKLHLVEKSADSRLDLTRRLAKFEAKLALEQLKKLRRGGEPPLREFYLVHDRAEVLKRLRKAGYFFDGLWYEKPVSPVRYYRKVHFPEHDCPVAVGVSEKIVNLPTYYSKKGLEPARKIIREYLDEEERE